MLESVVFKEGEREGRESFKLKNCSRCQNAHYFSRDCQFQHWRDHKKDCLSLQSKTLERDVTKSRTNVEKNPLSFLPQTAIAGNSSEAAQVAARAAENETDPQKRKVLQQFSRYMSKAAEEKFVFKVDRRLHFNPYRIYEYMMGNRPSSERARTSFKDTLDQIKPVLEDLGNLIHIFAGTAREKKDPVDVGRKHTKLSKHVRKMEMLGPEDRASYSHESLMAVEKMWRDQVADIMMGTMSAVFVNDDTYNAVFGHMVNTA